MLFFLSCLSFTWSWRTLKGLQWCPPEEGAWLQPLLDRWGNRGSGHPNCERPDDASRPRLPAPHWLPPSLPSLPQQLAAPGPGGSLQICRGRESSLPLLGACSRAQGSGMLQGTATQWRSHLLKGKAPQAQSFPSHWQGERGCPTGPCPSGSGAFQATVIPASLLTGSQAHLAQGNGRGLRLSALLQKDKRYAKDAG